MRDFLRASLAAEPTHPIAGLKLVKSAAELEWIRRAAALASLGVARFAQDLAAGKTELAPVVSQPARPDRRRLTPFLPAASSDGEANALRLEML